MAEQFYPSFESINSKPASGYLRQYSVSYIALCSDCSDQILLVTSDHSMTKQSDLCVPHYYILHSQLSVIKQSDWERQQLSRKVGGHTGWQGHQSFMEQKHKY